jgi:hypothetical protein
MADLNETQDIEGVALIEGTDSILAYDFPHHDNNKVEIQKILELLKETSTTAPVTSNNTYFAHNMLNYNGLRVLTKKLNKNRTLLVMLRKQGYISLAMLDIENSIRMIDEIMKGYIPKDHFL